MNCDINAEAPRPRPLSGGIWTLFSWLRRDERSISNESLSSAGSDRTAISFAFLEPLNYKGATEPILLPPLSPPTDSYRKRVRDRNFRRQRERDITLHRKYGLFKGENNDRFDAFSLPFAQRNSSGEKTERGRRAASESFQRRAPYVPGKRRAPLPPSTTTSLPRNFSRKRPAPQPPHNFTQISIENSGSKPMNSKSASDRRAFFNDNVSVENKSEKNIKQDKIKPDKNFLKQIFDNRKRNSASETTCIKLLPNISELDKQAAQIIENKKLKVLETGASISTNIDNVSGEKETAICPVCFRKYNVNTSSCLYCVPNQNKTIESDKKNFNVLSDLTINICTQTDKDVTSVTSTKKLSENEEKKKLKEMLKEMKDSLPKRAKHNILANNESPTLRIGSSSLTHKHETKVSPKPEEALNKSETPKTHSSNVKHYTDVLTKDSVLDSITTNSNIFQPSSSGLSANNPLKTSISEQQYKNAKNNLDLSQPNFKLYTQIDNNNITKKQILNDQALILNKTNNIPRIKPETTTSKNESVEKNNSNKKENSVQLLSKHSLFNKETDVVYIDKINKQQREFQQTSSENNLHVDSGIKKSQFMNSKNAEILKSSQLNSSISNNKTSVNNRIEKENNNVNKQTSSNSNFLRSVAGNNLISTKKMLTEKSISNNNEILNQPSEHKTTTPSIQITSNIHTPLKISSLLNPVYHPIQNYVVQNESQKNDNDKKTSYLQPQSSSSLNQKLMPIKEITEINEKESEEKLLKPTSNSVVKKYSTNTSVCKVLGVTPSTSKESENRPTSKIDHHSRRRELVNQLEKSIAKGDEQAAADAAIKLAKLRLSCSVLSFSSQIIGNSSENSKASENLSKPKEKDSEKIVMKQLLDSKEDIKQIEDRNYNKNTTHVNSIKNDADSTVSSKSNGKQEVKAATSKGNEREFKALINKTVVTQMDVKCGPSTSKSDNLENNMISIQVWVEDKEATRGPIFIQIPREATVGELRQKMEKSFGLHSRLQRWIVGRTLCLDVTTPLVSLAGPDLRAPFYLCLVESETKQDSSCSSKANEQTTTQEVKSDNGGAGEVYNELMKLEQQAIVTNNEAFECEVCMDICERGNGAVLRDCIHTFCRDCLSDVVRHCEEPIVSCPAMGCPGALQEREIRALLTTEEYERWLARGLATAESGTRNAFHCRTRDCTGWALCDPGVRKFPCPVCKCNNCVPCQAIHDGESCEQYQEKLRTAVTAAKANETDEGTQALLNSLIRRGEALECPECHAIITKKWGCDWVKCSACKTEICWVTRGRRWGPAGRGDTSAGCRCGVDGKRCHPSCGYCH